MPHKLAASKTEIIAKIIAQIHKKIPAPKAQLIAEFCRQLYDTVSVEDLLEHSAVDLYGASLAHWHFIYERQPKQAKVRVYNPTYEQTGFQSTHTVVEISQEDMPFLVDSVRMEINRLGFKTHLIIHTGGLKICREQGEIVAILPVEAEATAAAQSGVEAFIYVEIDHESDPGRLESLRDNLVRILSEVGVIVEDWPAMRERVILAVQDLENCPPPLGQEELRETKEFLKWLLEDHFTFLGYRAYNLIGAGPTLGLQVIEHSGLGVLRKLKHDSNVRLFSTFPPAAQALALAPEALVISTTNTKSSVHRPAYSVYIGVKRFNAQGQVIGEHRFIGLYTSMAYNSHPLHIPYLRSKVKKIIAMSKLQPKGHAGKDLLNILETFPRDDLFQAPIEQLFEIAMAILYVQERQCIRLFIIRDAYNRYLSCLVYLPKDQMSTELRRKMQAILERAFHSREVTFSTLFTESSLVRVHFLFRIDPQQQLNFTIEALEEKLVAAARSWQDELRQNLLETCGEEQGNKLIQQYLNAFPAGYRENFPVLTAVYDIEHMETLSATQPLALNFYQPIDEPENILRFKLFQLTNSIPLSDVLPILENLGLRVIGERPHEIVLKNGTSIWINDFAMTTLQNKPVAVATVKAIFQESFAKIWHGEAENDGFNRLVLSAELNWQQISMLRAYAKYLKQIKFTFSQNYLEQTLIENAKITQDLVKIFELRFAPKLADNTTGEIAALEQRVQQQLESVVSLEQDRILRRYLELIKATLRTNYYQKDQSGQIKKYLSLKINTKALTDLPLPRPLFEIFVYSPRFEGTHLRGATVARGGIRWSDRREDFRTEILGLMKAQTVKNALIVPSGAKGGFIPKNLPLESNNREAIAKEGKSCYQDFIRGLLDITDNVINGSVVPPVAMVRHDNDDPYLVVAADKGTATFSDIANQISHEYNFWLGDAFASGGTAGYDHKKIGITARGAWESVKRHFRELGIDIQTTDFTVVGIGDMSGDVFGNGMLLSRHIKLVGAFNHLHIFLDPNPDAATSYAERKRLFALPRSSWSDYNPALISPGGGVFNRAAKAIPLSAELQQLLNLAQEQATPNEVIRALLLAKVDLLWNGGIGTYVKAREETNLEVGDKANDAIRVNGEELNCRVVGEGGNLGCTQLGRVEYELARGGLINTDFIDNSGGVDCSDHEVNIKILLNHVVTNGDLTEKQRNQLLAEMTDEVAALVLRNNYEQTRAISLAAHEALRYGELYRSYIHHLENSGKLDRTLEFLPDDKKLTERFALGKSLTRAELSILFAYSKINLKEAILASDVPEDPCFAHMIELEFPQQLTQKFRAEMENHGLRREIIATQISNAMVNQLEMTFVYRLQDETGAQVPAIVRAYAIASRIFALSTLLQEIEALDLKIPHTVQFKLMAEVGRLIRWAARWFLCRQRVYLDVESNVVRFYQGVTALNQQLPHLLAGESQKKFLAAVAQYSEVGVTATLAHFAASVRTVFSLLDIIEASTAHQFDLVMTAKVYFSLNDVLELNWLREQITDFAVETHWDALAREALRDDLDLRQIELAVAILQHSAAVAQPEAKIAAWLAHHQELITRWHKILADLRASGGLSFVKLSVVIRELLSLSQTSFDVTQAAKVK